MGSDAAQRVTSRQGRHVALVTTYTSKLVARLLELDIWLDKESLVQDLMRWFLDHCVADTLLSSMLEMRQQLLSKVEVYAREAIP